MKKPPLTRLSSYLLDLYKSAHQQPITQFQDLVMEKLKQLLPFDSGMWGTGVMQTEGIGIHTLHLYNSTQQMIHEYQQVKHLDVFAQEVVRIRSGTVIGKSEDVPGPLEDFLEKFEHRNLLITCDVNPITKYVQWISLYRKDRYAKYTVHEPDLFTSLAPHLMQALTLNRAQNVGNILGDFSREKWRIAITDRVGFYLHADGFLDLIRQEFVELNEFRLPQEVLALAVKKKTTFRGEKTFIRMAVENDMVFLMIRPLTIADQLSEKEFTLAKMLASGLAYKDVARQLSLSPETIRTYSKAIFNKLNIHKVTELPKLLALKE